MSKAPKVWFITGISRGLGEALAQAVLARGDLVVGTSRDGKAKIHHERLHVLPLDVAKREAVFAAVKQAQGFHGRLDVIVNNAGFGLLGSVEQSAPSEVDEVLAVNFYGTLNVIQAALPFLREQGTGHIINLSSIAGLAPGAGSGIYAAAKFAVEGMSQSLALEVKDLGIRVTVVEPGAFRTDFLSSNSIRHTEKPIDAYASSAGHMVDYLAKMDGNQLGNPELGAAAILKVVDSDNPPMHLLMGSDAHRRTHEMLDKFTRELKEWEAVTLSTDYQTAGAKS